jgi:hypothetical protein
MVGAEHHVHYDCIVTRVGKEGTMTLCVAESGG